MMFCPSRSRMFIFVFCSSGILSQISSLKPASSSLSGNLPDKKQVSDLFETETFLLDQPVCDVLHIVSAVKQFSRDRFQSAFRQTLVTHHIIDFRQSDQHSCTVLRYEARASHYTLGTVRCQSCMLLWMHRTIYK